MILFPGENLASALGLQQQHQGRLPGVRPAVVGDRETREQLVDQLHRRSFRKRTLSRRRKSTRLQENLRSRFALQIRAGKISV